MIPFYPLLFYVNSFVLLENVKYPKNPVNTYAKPTTIIENVITKLIFLRVGFYSS